MTKAFADTTIVNRILDIDQDRDDEKYREDKYYLEKILGEFIENEQVVLFINPSIKQEIENTNNQQRKQLLMSELSKYHFIEFNKTVFPFHFPAKFVTDKENAFLEELRSEIKGFGKDAKIFIDALTNGETNILLTTDRTHLAIKGLRTYTKNNVSSDFDIYTPKEFYEFLVEKD